MTISIIIQQILTNLLNIQDTNEGFYH